MRISINNNSLDENKMYAIINTHNACIHIYEDDYKTEICFYDHAKITIEGEWKKLPLMTIDSDEYPTKIRIVETEHKWLWEDK